MTHQFHVLSPHRDGGLKLKCVLKVNGLPLRTLSTYSSGVDRGRPTRWAPCDRASEQRRTKADPRTHRSGESAYGTYSASDDGDGVR